MSLDLLSALTPLLAASAVTVPIVLMGLGFAVVSVVLILVILIQKPKGGGLSGAFGGAASNEGAFIGGKVGDFLTVLTVGFFIAFVALAMGLTWATTPDANPTAAAPAAPAGGMGAGAGGDGGEVDVEQSTSVDFGDVGELAEDAILGGPDAEVEVIDPVDPADTLTVESLEADAPAEPVAPAAAE